jgi:hypothetical protein
MVIGMVYHTIILVYCKWIKSSPPSSSIIITRAEEEEEESLV